VNFALQVPLSLLVVRLSLNANPALMVLLPRLVPLLAIDAVLVTILTRLHACTAPSELSLLAL